MVVVKICLHTSLRSTCKASNRSRKDKRFRSKSQQDRRVSKLATFKQRKCPLERSLHEKPGTCPAFLSVCFHHRLIRAPSSHREVVAKPDSFKGVGTVLPRYSLLAASRHLDHVGTRNGTLQRLRVGARTEGPNHRKTSRRHRRRSGASCHKETDGTTGTGQRHQSIRRCKLLELRDLLFRSRPTKLVSR